MTKQQLSATVEASGPFFRVDPGETFLQNVSRFTDRIAEYGEDKARGIIASKPMPLSTGWTRDHTIGRTKAKASKGGREWKAWAVVQLSSEGMSKKDAIRTMAAGASVERRFHPFRSTTFAIRSRVRDFVGDFTKGLE